MGKFESVKIKVFGDTDQISSERYFITIISLIAAIFLLGLCFVHIFMGLKIAPVLFAGSSSIAMICLYYFVRFRNCLFIPKVLLSVLGLVMLDFTWYSKFLSNGPVLFFILIFAALIIWVWEGRGLAILLAFYFLNLSVLFYVDYSAPDYLFKYPDTKSRSVDIYLSFLLYSSLLTILLYIIKREFIRQKEKALESDRLKSAFLANMSHEIRTPMNGILGFAELLKEPDLSGEKQQEYVEIIEKSGQRMLNIINDIIDISKIESGQMKVHLKKVNVNNHFKYLDTFFTPEVKSKGLQIFFRNNLPLSTATIITDGEKLDAILINLVKNAIKYTDNGSIQIGCDIMNQKDTKSLQFYIKDTGIGIPKEMQEVIFDRFIRTEFVEKMAKQGAGLGLAITKAYLEMLGGKIWMESEIGKGSTFFFTIPYKTESVGLPNNATSAGTVEESESQIKKLKLLIAEDDTTSEILVSRILKAISKEILKVNTGVDAVEVCRNNPDIDLILMDIQMPRMNGYDSTHEIRQFNNDVIIIAQTAFGLAGDREKAIESGCNDYIAKPIKKAELLALIHKYF